MMQLHRFFLVFHSKLSMFLEEKKTTSPSFDCRTSHDDSLVFLLSFLYATLDSSGRETKTEWILSPLFPSVFECDLSFGSEILSLFLRFLPLDSFLEVSKCHALSYYEVFSMLLFFTSGSSDLMSLDSHFESHSCSSRILTQFTSRFTPDFLSSCSFCIGEDTLHRLPSMMIKKEGI
jgi:hypothetical protein